VRLLSRLRAGWRLYFFRAASATDLCVARVVFFSVAFVYYAPQEFREWGSVSKEFWMPGAFFRVLHLPILDTAGLAIVEVAWKVALGMAAIGLWTRIAMPACFIGAFYLLGLPQNFGQVQHFDTLIVLIFGILAFSHAGDAWSIDAWRARRLHPGRQPAEPVSPEYRWPVRAIWTTAALVFFAAGFSKLRHSGLTWIFSDHLATLLVRHQYHVSDGEPLTAWGPIVASYPWAARGLAAISILTETLYPLALFSRRARYVIVPAGIGFLVGIRALMGPTFEALLICHVFWVRWEWVVDRVRDVLLRRRAARAARNSQANAIAG